MLGWTPALLRYPRSVIVSRYFRFLSRDSIALDKKLSKVYHSAMNNKHIARVSRAHRAKAVTDFINFQFGCDNITAEMQPVFQNADEYEIFANCRRGDVRMLKIAICAFLRGAEWQESRV